MDDELLYTGEEFDEVLNSCAREGDWIEVREGFYHKGVKNKFMYPIKEVIRKLRDSRISAKIKNNLGELIVVPLEEFKYITYKQRKSVEARLIVS